LIEYRRPFPREAEAMAALHVRCWREAYAGLVPHEILDGADPKEMAPRWLDHISNADRYVMAAFEESLAVAFINQGAPVEKLFPEMDGHIAALYMAQKYYRQGIGRKLMAMAARDWLDKGGHSICLGVLSENIRARKFYESMGGKAVKTGVFNWKGHALPDVIYLFDDLPALIP
jgi:ribosomal protein S18 acetylase RimI-like enzyme